MQRLEESPLDAVIKKRLREMLNAKQDIASIVASLPQERRAIVDTSASQLRTLSKGILARGRAGLMDMTDTAWKRLVDASGDE